MRFKISNLGKVKSTEIELNDLTVICGKNNTGKTYITYGLYGFMDFIHNLKFNQLDYFDEYLNPLITNEVPRISIPLEVFYSFVKNNLTQQFAEEVPNLFASKKRIFKNASIELLDNIDVKPLSFETLARINPFSEFIIRKDKDNDKIFISKLSVQSESIDKKYELKPSDIKFATRSVIKFILAELFLKQIPDVFASSVERSGISIFHKEITLSRSKQWGEMLFNDNGKQLFTDNKVKPRSYPLAIKDNLEFVQRLFFTDRETSPLITKHPNLLTEFQDIAGGKYIIDDEIEEILFIPYNSNLKLLMMESSSSVRSLCDLGIYLEFFAKEGDLIIIDEPELNLHPENQRKLARLFTKLINHGLKILVTTHSDYIIKELSILGILKHNSEYLEEINLVSNHQYSASELLDLSKVKVFISKESDGAISLESCEISNSFGISLPTFDDTIEDINVIMDVIAFPPSN